MQSHPNLLVASGNCNAYAGVGDPYLPFREVLGMLSGDVETRWTSGTITKEHALRLWNAIPQTTNALLEHGASLIDILVSGPALLGWTTSAMAGDQQLLHQLREVIDQRRIRSTGLEQSYLFEQMTNVLGSITETKPLLITLDDLQWADTASISMLFHLGRRLAGKRILILAAYRPEEVRIGRDREKHPLEKLLAEFKRQFGNISVNLGQTAVEDRYKFVNDFLDTEPNQLPQDFRQVLFRRTGGHPLFTIELLKALQERGDLVQDGQGCWVVSETLAWDQLPVRIEAVIAERTGRLEADLHDLLSIASVEGEAFTPRVIAQVQEVNERHLLRQLSQELERRHRLIREGDEWRVDGKRLSRYRFTHHLFQRYLYNELSAGERRLLHGEIATVLEALFTDYSAEIAVQLAYHYGKAEDHDKERTYLIQAGQQALAAYAHQEAEKQLRRALELAEAKEERAELLSGLGEALYGQNRFLEAIRIWRKGIELYQKLGAEGRNGMAHLYARAARAASDSGDWPGNLQLCEEGLAALVEAPESQGVALLLHEAGRSYFFNGISVKGEKLCREALAMAELLGVLEVQADALATYGLLANLSIEEAFEALN